MTANLHRSQTLDAVRGIAILGVVVWHYWGQHPADVHYPLWLSRVERLAVLGRTGVDLFFVLSGYLLGGILLDNRNSPTYYTSFYGRRLLRIAPLYILALALFFALRSVLPWEGSAHANMFANPGPAWSYWLLLQNNIWAWRDAYGPGMLAVTWSLAVEEQFYLILPLLLCLTPRAAVGRVCLGLMAFAPIWRAGLMLLLPDHPLARNLLLPSHFDTLFGGVLAAWIVRDPLASLDLVQRRKQLMQLLLILVMGLAWMAVRGIGHLNTPSFDIWAYSYFAAIYILGLLVVVSGPAAIPAVTTARKPLVWLGLGAYSIYLFHWPIQSLIEVAMGHRGWLPNLVSMATVCFVGWICWVAIEKPLIAHAKVRFRYRHADELAADSSARVEFRR